MRQAKVVLYPIFGVYQFHLATLHGAWWPFYVAIGVALIGLGIVNLLKLTTSKPDGG